MSTPRGHLRLHLWCLQDTYRQSTFRCDDEVLRSLYLCLYLPLCVCVCVGVGLYKVCSCVLNTLFSVPTHQTFCLFSNNRENNPHARSYQDVIKMCVETCCKVYIGIGVVQQVFCFTYESLSSLTFERPLEHL